MEHIIKLKRIEPPVSVTLDAHDYYTLLSLLTDQIIEHMKSAEEAGLSYDAPQLAGLHYLETLHKKLVPFQIGQRSVELRLEEEQ